MHRIALTIAALFVVSIAACDEGATSPGQQAGDPAAPGDNPGESPDDTPGDDPGEDPGESPEPAAGSACPEGWTTLNMRVDDSANRTYADGEIIWTGSFAHDELTNVLSYSTSWLPDEGPYPLLFDDGPVSEGGHEPEGEVAGDSIFGASVCYEATEDKAFSYGLLNDDLRWIWIGPNGTFDVPAGHDGVMDLPGMAFEPFGDKDFKVTLDMNALHADFEGTSLDDVGVFIKGTMNSWTPIQLLDDGKGGDAAAGDGVVTYQHSLYLGAHDGLLRAGQEAQFVFVFTIGDTDPDDGLEYKVGGDAAIEGVAASAFCNEGLVATPVVQSLDSRGKALNTAIVACPDDPVVVPDPVDPDPDPVVPDPDPEPDPDPVDPDPEPDPDPVDPDPEPEPIDCGDEPCDKPELYLVLPANGAAEGGEQVSLPGDYPEMIVQVTFGGAEGTILSQDAKELVVTTPAHAAGPVDVVVTADSGLSATFPGGFTFYGEGGPVTPGGLKIDGAIGVSEWQGAEIASNGTASDWGPNTLETLYAQTDGSNLYVGIAGAVEEGSGNAIVVYIDADFGGGTGVVDTSVLEDDGWVDAALGGVTSFSGGFGAELGFGVIETWDYTPGIDDPGATGAGWRGFADVTDMPWLLSGAVSASGSAVEASIPLGEVFGSPAGQPRTLAITVRLVSGNGDYASNQMLPGDGGAAVFELTY